MTAVDPATYEPTEPHLIVVRSRLSRAAWIARVAKAQQAACVMKEIATHVRNGDSLDAAIRKAVPASRRSWVIRHWRSFNKLGWEALIDKRLSREPKIAKACGKLIETSREANPEISVSAVLAILRAQHVKPLPSPSTIRSYLKRADRRMGRRKRKERVAEEIIETSFAGGELLLAAEMETGAIAALTTEVENLAREAKDASEGLVPKRDTHHRDELGHFTAEYNKRRTRKPGEEIASYLRSAEEKAEGRIRTWPRFVHEGRHTLDAKLKALTFAPLVSATQGWDALRSAQAADLGTLAGVAYMPSTLAKFTSALAISGAGDRLLEAMGTNWHGIASKRWGEAGAMAALYVDNHAKEVWTSLFTMSGKVASLNRVMPCITTTYMHTGAGTPIVASVQSGSAPLAPRLLALVERAEKVLGDGVTRATIIDAEGSVFDVLETFAKAGRIIVTPLRPSRAPELELTYAPGSYFRPYRDHDELRIAQAQLHHRSTGRSLDLAALLVRRGDRESETVLLAAGTQHGFNGRDLADLYFLRWPLQENFFKDGEVVDLDRHRGNSSRMVANIAVVTKLEKLQNQRQRTTEELRERRQSEATEANFVAAAEREHRAAQSRLEKRRERMDEMIESEKIESKSFSKVAIEHHDALQRAEKASKAFEQTKAKLTTTQRLIKVCESRIEKQNEQEKKLGPRQKIRQLDTALDSILTSTKLTCLLLISFVLREYLSALPMSPQTFVSRVFSIRGRRELRPREEWVIFYENVRDPEVTSVLEDACKRLNARQLSRNGREIRYRVEKPPNT